MTLGRLLMLSLRLAWHLLMTVAMPRAAGVIGRCRSNRQTLRSWPEDASPAAVPLGPRIAIFAHFDAAGGVREHVLHYLHALREAGLDIVFATNSGTLRPEAEAALRELCAVIIVRRNVGYDFGAWADALAQLDLPRAGTESVVLANDSVYGPLRPLDDVLDRADPHVASLWGLTESWQTRWHLQSYFLVASAALVGSDEWRRFWATVRPAPSKQYIIQAYEIGLSQAVLRGGHVAQAVWNYEALIEQVDPALIAPVAAEADDNNDNENDDHIPRLSRGGDPILDVRRRHALRVREAAATRHALNPTSDLWRQLLRAGFPFIKRELLRDNPSEVADIADWRRELLNETDADPGIIERDLRRATRGRVG